MGARLCKFSVYLLPPWLAVTAFAFDGTGDELLDEIVVAATRYETSVRDVARSISVVNKERIQLGTRSSV